MPLVIHHDFEIKPVNFQLFNLQWYLCKVTQQVFHPQGCKEARQYCYRTWNHLTCRSSARASRHFCLSSTSGGSGLPTTAATGAAEDSITKQQQVTKVNQRETSHCRTGDLFDRIPQPGWLAGWEKAYMRQCKSIFSNLKSNIFNSKRIVQWHEAKHGKLQPAFIFCHSAFFFQYVELCI